VLSADVLGIRDDTTVRMQDAKRCGARCGRQRFLVCTVVREKTILYNVLIFNQSRGQRWAVRNILGSFLHGHAVVDAYGVP